MDFVSIGVLLVTVLLFLLGSGVWVAISMLAVSILGIVAFTNAPFELVMSSTIWASLSGWSLTALPLFIWMGEILYRSRLSGELFEGLSPWIRRLPGSLLHVNVLACGVFAAVSGSSAATAATVGKMTLPELKQRGYDQRMSLGSLAASGSLGLLIPPSILLIVYGVAAQVSIARLFLAGILPGLLVITLLMGYIGIWSILNPKRTPPAPERTSWREKLARLRLLLPVVALIAGVIGSMYMGVATPTEAATIGVVGSLVIARYSGGLTWVSFRESLVGAVRTTCMIGLILAAAAFLTAVMGYTGIPRALAHWIAEQNLSTYMLMVALTVVFIILGCFLDGISVVVLTTAIIMPMMRAAEIDLIWFGIYIVLIVEIGQITPPVGFNLFVVQALSGRDLGYVARSTVPFFFILLFAIGILTIVPEIATWLPTTMMTR